MRVNSSIVSKLISPVREAHKRSTRASKTHIAFYDDQQMLVIVTPSRTGGEPETHCLPYSFIGKEINRFSSDPAMREILQICQSKMYQEIIDRIFSLQLDSMTFSRSDEAVLLSCRLKGTEHSDKTLLLQLPFEKIDDAMKRAEAGNRGIIFYALMDVKEDLYNNHPKPPGHKPERLQL